jgi:hypothetical protein
MDIKSRIETANNEAIQRIYDSQTTWVGVERAVDVIPGMKKNMILHAGPPISYVNMCVPQQIAVKGALIYEGLAKNIEEAERIAQSDEIILEPCHQHRTVGSMCGITSASMPVNIVRNDTFGNEAYCLIYETPERHRLSFGYYDENVLGQLKWLEHVMWPALDYAVKKLNGINTKRIIARALSMGDECHSRHWAATALLSLELMPIWLEGGFDSDKAAEAAKFIARSDQFFLHLTMASCKATADAVEGIEYSTVVTAIARNGVDVGIRVSGLPGQWFTGPSGLIEGLYFSGYSIKDSNPDLGDSAITETMGLGAAAMAAAPAFEVVGGTLQKALNTTLEMNEITVGNNPNFQIATLNGLGTPTGIDIRLVVEKGISPTIDTGIAHKEGFGQIGVGNAKAPKEAFEKALKSFGKKYASEFRKEPEQVNK